MTAIEILRSALEKINEWCCYASEEDTGARVVALQNIGIHARSALAASQAQQPAPAEPALTKRDIEVICDALDYWNDNFDKCQAVKRKLLHAALAAAAAVEPPVVPQRYQHVKTGGVYEVVCDEAKRESDCERLVVYRSATTGMVWVRPASEFFDGRFTEVRGIGSVPPSDLALDSNANSVHQDRRSGGGVRTEPGDAS